MDKKYIRVDNKTHETVKSEALKKNITMKQLVNNAITKYLEKNEKSTINNPEIHQAKYDISHGTKYLNKMSKIAENIIEHYQLLKLETYPITIQEAGLDIMRKVSNFLKEQLNYKKEIIIVKAE